MAQIGGNEKSSVESERHKYLGGSDIKDLLPGKKLFPTMFFKKNKYGVTSAPANAYGVALMKLLRLEKDFSRIPNINPIIAYGNGMEPLIRDYVAEIENCKITEPKVIKPVSEIFGDKAVFNDPLFNIKVRHHHDGLGSDFLLECKTLNESTKAITYMERGTNGKFKKINPDRLKDYLAQALYGAKLYPEDQITRVIIGVYARTGSAYIQEVNNNQFTFDKNNVFVKSYNVSSPALKKMWKELTQGVEDFAKVYTYLRKQWIEKETIAPEEEVYLDEDTKKLLEQEELLNQIEILEVSRKQKEASLKETVTNLNILKEELLEAIGDVELKSTINNLSYTIKENKESKKLVLSSIKSADLEQYQILMDRFGKDNPSFGKFTLTTRQLKGFGEFNSQSHLNDTITEDDEL